MKEQYLTNDQLIDMIKSQELLNISYQGENWREKFRQGYLKASLLHEVGEFLTETEIDWKIWKTDRKEMNQSKAIIEFVDILHFMIALLLYRNSVEKLVFIAQGGLGPDSYGEYKDIYNEMFKSMNRFLGAIDIDNPYIGILQLRNFIENGSALLSIKPSMIYASYKLKNELNFERACGGDTYDRSKERELKPQ